MFNGLHIFIKCTRGSVLNGFSLAVSLVQLSTDEVPQINFSNIVHNNLELVCQNGWELPLALIECTFTDGLYFYEID